MGREIKIVPCLLTEDNKAINQGPWIDVDDFTPKDVREIQKMVKNSPDKKPRVKGLRRGISPEIRLKIHS